MTTPSSRELESSARDALYLARVVLARVEHRPVLSYSAGAEVEAPDELADDEQIDLAATGRAQIRIDVELGAELEHPLLGTNLGGVELGVADRCLEHGVGGMAGRERLGRERRARRADRGRADEVLLELEIGRELPQDALRDGHHLGPDAVAGKAHDARACVQSRHEECRHYKLGSAL